jgi:tetratricopeptide (TPR) repeat protein
VFSVDDRWVIIATPSGILSVWDWRSGQRVLPDHRTEQLFDWIYTYRRTLHLSPDGRWIAIGGRPHTEVVSLTDLFDPIDWTAEELLAWAELQSFRRVHEGGTLAILTTEEWQERWQKLQRAGRIRSPILPPADTPLYRAERLLSAGLSQQAFIALQESLAKSPNDLATIRLFVRVCRTLSDQREREGKSTESKEYQDRIDQVCTRFLANHADENIAKEYASFLLRRNCRWQVLPADELHSAGGATLTRQPDGSILASGTNADKDTYTITCKGKLADIAGLRLEALPDPSLPDNGPGRVSDPIYAGLFHLGEMKVQTRTQTGDWLSHTFRVVAENVNPVHPATDLIDGNAATGWSIFPHVGKTHQAIFPALQSFQAPEGLKIELVSAIASNRANLGRFRLSFTSDLRTLDAETWLVAFAKSNNGLAQFALAQHLQGQHQEALASLQRIESPDGMAHFLTGLIQASQNQLEQAEAACQRGLDWLATHVPDEATSLSARRCLQKVRKLEDHAIEKMLPTLEDRRLLRILSEAITRYPKSDAALAARARWYGLRDRYKEAAADMLEAVKLNPKNLHWLQAGIALAAAGDVEGHRKHSRAMFEQFLKPTAQIAEQTIKVTLLLPPEPEDLKRAEERLRAIPTNSTSWQAFAIALTEHRRGNLEETSKRIQSLLNDPTTQVNKALLASCHLLESLTLVAKKNLASARDSINKAKELMKLRPANAKDGAEGWFWHEVAFCQVLLREAEALAKSDGK